MSHKDNPEYIKEITERQQEVAKLVLNELEDLGYKNAVLAGGAPRDWYLNRVASDLDFFVDAQGYIKDIDAMHKFFTKFNTEGKELEQSGIYEKNPKLIKVIEFKIKDIKCQVIFIENAGIKDFDVTAANIHLTFPVNVSKIKFFWNKDILDYCTETTPEFIFSHQYKILDFDEDGLYNTYYKKKIKKKFPDYGVVSRSKPKKKKLVIDFNKDLELVV